ncbi:sybindin-like family protein [Grosmannia clavigera kw1407]|uniref:Trafficking protein particle complex subunit n=1 Tax=Grosmannia clavigera (strain kw1407 / UAMH 11150) TaxID=655863 RepID=F0XC90_GROCL|nr:sybindin-like family protein [Grosmannia clavigera kw1407]EFX04278.1 sybindin-like family protein [Grosmannia clavigera kw1407]
MVRQAVEGGVAGAGERSGKMCGVRQQALVESANSHAPRILNGPARDDAIVAARQHTMTIFALTVINKAGGLVYNRTFHEGGLNQLSTNDYLIIAGTFHGVHAITTRLNPLKHLRGAAGGPAAGGAPPGSVMTPTGLAPSRPDPPSGLEVLESENFRMQCFTTLTGTKFLLFTDTAQISADATIRRIYDLYADYVMKNPFYQLEMPIRCEIFDRKLNSYIRETNNR